MASCCACWCGGCCWGGPLDGWELGGSVDIVGAAAEAGGPFPMAGFLGGFFLGGAVCSLRCAWGSVSDCITSSCNGLPG
eukprot:1143271-Pelagomonas_calceolata.AAC.5